MYSGVIGLLFLTTVLAVAGVGYLAADAGERATLRARNVLAAAERRDRRLLRRLDAAVRRTGPGAAVAAHLAGGGITWSPVTFLAGLLGAAGAVYLVVRQILPVWVALPAAVGGAYAVWWWVERARRKRHEQFIGQLPDVARLISAGSQAGLSLQSALDLAEAELDDPAREELGRVVSQIQLGQSLEGALADLHRRMPGRDVGVLVSTLVIQQRAGGDVVEALSDLARTLDARRTTAREVKVMLVGAVFTSYVIPFLVGGLLLLLNLTSPGALEEMAGSLVGRVVLAVSGTMTAVGFLMIRRITRIPA